MNKEIIEILLAAAGVFVVVWLLYGLISPSFDKVDKTSEAFFDTFLEQVSVADKNGVGKFSIWQKEDKVRYFLVYFGSGKSHEVEDENFVALKEGDNLVCLCSVEEDKRSCEYCKNLNSVVELKGEEGREYIGYGEEIEMRFVNGFYKFEKVGNE